LFHAIKKVYYAKSSDWFWGELTKAQQRGIGLFNRVLNNTTPSRVFNRESTEGLLLRLVELSALPMREIEEHGTVAIDSTGFATTVRPCYNDQVDMTGRKRRFVKMHVIIGTRSHAILAIVVTDDRGADSPQLIPLIQQVIDAGFLPDTFTGDKGYLSRDAYTFLAEHGIDGYIPFKISNTGKAGGSPEYHRKCLQFAMHRKFFEEKYHARSNVESVFGAIKKRFQEGLRSKNQGAMFCEVLAKAVCWNITALVRLSYENQVELPETRAGTYAQGGARIEAVPAAA
ncbi:MAG: transposase, partial [Thermoplasmata archaeon]|nr:transposase [Thermoplasmata archaeon]